MVIKLQTIYLVKFLQQTLVSQDKPKQDDPVGQLTKGTARLTIQNTTSNNSAVQHVAVITRFSTLLDQFYQNHTRHFPECENSCLVTNETTNLSYKEKLSFLEELLLEKCKMLTLTLNDIDSVSKSSPYLNALWYKSVFITAYQTIQLAGVGRVLSLTSLDRAGTQLLDKISDVLHIESNGMNSLIYVAKLQQNTS